MTAPLEKQLHVFFINKIQVISDVKTGWNLYVWLETKKVIKEKIKAFNKQTSDLRSEMVWNLLKTDEIQRNLVNKNSTVVLWT